MRPTAVRMFGEMPNGKHYLGWWGDLGSPKQKGIVTYGISSNRAAPLRNMFRDYLFNGFHRIGGHLPYVVPPVAIGYAIYAWAKKRDAWQTSKAGHIAMMEEEGGHH
ncbi:QCR8 [Sanghuangporus weigelae]